MVLGPTVRKFLPYINFVVASSALVFQTAVLYPWHKKLDEDFYILKDEQNAKLAKYHQIKLEALSHIEGDIVELKKQQTEIQREIQLANGNGVGNGNGNGFSN
jgi:hypothetical protein